MSQETVSTYEGKELTITYDRRRCIHAAECGRGSSVLFNPKSSPWIDPDAVPVEVAADVVERCPTEALTYRRNDGGPEEATPSVNRLMVNPKGPIYARGEIVIRDGDGNEVAREKRVALCRCGQSENKPYCDGRHAKVDFLDPGPVNSSPEGNDEEGGELTVTALTDGPLLVSGNLKLMAASGRVAADGAKMALCRCGDSSNKPFCDGTHRKSGFKA